MTTALCVSVQAQQPEDVEVKKGLASKSSATSRLVGIVTDTAGTPIADAKVRVVIPSADVRFAVDPNEHREVWGETDPTGSYSIKIDGIEQVTAASLDILHPGHRRLVGTLMSGGTPNEIKLSPGGSTEFDAKLPEAMYFAGQVVDEAGNPIEGVSVASVLRTARSSAGVERTMTNEQGRFAVFGYERKFFEDESFLNRGVPTADLFFRHDRYIDAAQRNLESVEPANHDGLRIVMKSGHSIAGIVSDPQDAAVGDLVVSLSQVESGQRKAVRIDEEGRFRFDGVSDGNAILRVVDVWGNRKSIQHLAIDASNTEMTISLQPIDAPSTTEFGVLGMKLTDVTPAISKAYELNAENTLGVMIIDPGQHSTELAIGELRPGYVFWMVGNDRVRDLRTMVNHLVREATSPTIPPGGIGNTSAWIEKDGAAKVRVVYKFDSESGRGTNTQYMRLEPRDVAELIKLRERLESMNAE